MEAPTHNKGKKARGPRPETVEKYREALELYRTTDISCRDICRRLGLSVESFSGYIFRHHRNLTLARHHISCSPEESQSIKLNKLRGQNPATHTKYKDAIQACGSMKHIEDNVFLMERLFGLNGTNLGRLLHSYYPDILEFQEIAQKRSGLDDHLHRDSRSFSKEQYAEAVDLLRGNSYYMALVALYCLGYRDQQSRVCETFEILHQALQERQDRLY